MPSLNHIGAVALGSAMDRGAVAALVVLAAGLTASPAFGQAPSFAQAPTGDYTTGAGVSPDGRFVTGQNLMWTEPYRWNRLTGQIVHMSGPWRSWGSAVLSDGRVFGGWEDNFDTTAQIKAIRWNPDATHVDFASRLAFPSRSMTVSRVSRDGEYGLGWAIAGNGASNAVVINYAGGTGAGVANDLITAPGAYGYNYDRDHANLANVTLPINGTRYAYGAAWFPDVGDWRGVIWTLPFVQGMRDDSWETFSDVSPDARFILGRSGGQPVVRGNGPAWFLAAPTTPVMSTPDAYAMSDDGSVVVGKAYNPAATTLHKRDAVVWRRGQPPARLRDILASAGVSMPAYDAATLNAVSADGSVVVGTYRIEQAFQDVERAFVAVLPSLNDNCGTAKPVTYGTTLSTTNGATRAGVAATCTSEGTAPDVWFSFTPLANETITIDTCGSSFDTTLNLFQASSCASVGGALACNDDASPACSDNAHASRITASVFANTNYFIRVSGWNGAYGSVRLTITAPNRPANDACAQATNVVPGTSAAFTNVNAITDSRPPCGGTPFNDIWFKSVAPESGRMTFGTCGSTINTVMAVYDASACADFSVAALACGSSNAACTIVGGGNGTRITVNCVAGQTFLIRVGGLFGASGSGTFTSTFACDQNNLSPYAVSVLNSGPLNYWRFDDSGSITAADAVRFDQYLCGYGPGQYVGAVNRVPDFQGKALNLDGTGAYARVWAAANITNPSACSADSGRATLEAWIKTTDPMAGVVLTNRSNPGEFSLTLVVGYNTVGIPNTEGKVMFIADGPGNFHGAISNVRVDDGRWHHIVGFRGPSSGPFVNYYIAVDGVLQGFDNLPGVGTAHSGTNGWYWNIGHGPAWPVEGAAFNGRIDEAAIYCGNPNLSNHYTIGKPCPADLDDGTGTGTPNAGVDVNDLVYFLSTFEDGGPGADLDDGSGLGRPDGGVDVSDLLYFLVHFESGC
jgi:Concanavalin A-like lectin/glucanases superfamily